MKLCDICGGGSATSGRVNFRFYVNDETMSHTIEGELCSECLGKLSNQQITKLSSLAQLIKSQSPTWLQSGQMKTSERRRSLILDDPPQSQSNSDG